MYEDMSADELAREEWEDTIQSFVPAFAQVTPTVIRKQEREYDAHLAIDKDGQLIVRLLTDDENEEIKIPMSKLFAFDTDQFKLESWELYIGLVETYMQMRDIIKDFEQRVDAAGDIMYERGFDISDAQLRVVSNNEAKQSQ